MEEISFEKMQGLGNDYVYILCMDELPKVPSELAKEISDRHFGVGGDGLVLITRSEVAYFRMIMYNNDGSEAQMCGNASRCIGRLVYEKGLTDKTDFTLETRAGIKKIKINLKDGEVKDISVNMGKPVLKCSEIPVNETVLAEPLPFHRFEMGGREIGMFCVGMGNPHGVIFMDVDEEYFQKYGPRLECHPIWPEKANIEFVKVISDKEIEMRVWERGTGETLACGTGACASAVASILTGRTSREVTVKMKGGNLKIELNEEGEIIMTGDAQHVASGIYYKKH